MNTSSNSSRGISRTALEENQIPFCSDWLFVSGRKKVLKLKTSSLLNIFDICNASVDKFCEGEKVLLKKRYYSSLYSDIVKGSLSTGTTLEEVKQRLLAIHQFLIIVFENNLIKSYKKYQRNSILM